MHSGGTKLRAAEWLYRWNLSLSILGVVFTILTFLGVFTLVLGPAFAVLGLSYLATSLILAAAVVLVIIGFGVFLDIVVKFWSAQATVATTRNPFLVAVLYQKELLALKHVQVPQLTALLALVQGQPESQNKEWVQEYLHSSLRRLEEAISRKEWRIDPEERVY